MNDLTNAEIDILLLALNDREGVLSTDFLRASETGGLAEVEQLRRELAEVRALSYKIALAAARRA